MSVRELAVRRLALPTTHKQWSPTEFREAYIAAKTESARRDVFLRALDEGVIAIGKSVAAIDTIASTQFNNERPDF